MSNVLFFPYFVFGTFHFGTDFELIQKELKQDNSVYILNCTGELKLCDSLITERWCTTEKTCKNCIKVRKRAYKLLQNKSKLHFISIKRLSSRNTLIKPINSIEDLLNISYNNYTIGYSIGSSLSAELEIEPLEALLPEIKLLLKLLPAFYENVIEILKKYNIDYSYVFNGRFSFTRAFFEANKYLNKDIYCHERGCNFRKYFLFKNNLPHSISNFTTLVNTQWLTESNRKKKDSVASKFFSDKANGLDTTFVSFTSSQSSNLLPDKFYSYKKKIAIFNSSDFEYKFIGKEFCCCFYESQYQGILQICTDLQNYSEIGIFIREHPNLKQFNIKTSYQRKQLRNISFSNCHLIPSESKISSYALLENADIIITFNSTMGIEATFWRKPSINCAHSIYEQLNIAYQPTSHKEMIELLLTDKLPPKEITDTMKYGFFSNTYGYDFLYYKPLTWNFGLFENEKDIYSNLMSFRQKFISILYFIFQKMPFHQLVSRIVHKIFAQKKQSDSQY